MLGPLGIGLAVLMLLASCGKSTDQTAPAEQQTGKAPQSAADKPAAEAVVAEAVEAVAAEAKVAVVAVAEAQVVAPAGSPEERIKNNLKKARQDMNVLKIEKSPIKGLYTSIM